MNKEIIETKEMIPVADKKACCDCLMHKKIVVITTVIGLFLLLLISFAAGVSVGFHKANFSSRFGENYERNFMGPRPDMMGHEFGPAGMMREKVGDFVGRGMRNGHGIAGTIISISDNSIVIKDRDNKENTISVNDKTIINQGRDTIKIEDLTSENEIVVIGRPGDNGVIQADLIRVFNKKENNNQ
jgi:hypothetical protein